MQGHFSLLAFILATGAVHHLPALPDKTQLGWLCAIVLVFSLLMVRDCQNRYGRMALCLPLWAALAGVLLTVYRADQRLLDTLAATNVDLVSRVQIRVSSLPDYYSGSQQFEAEVLASVPAGVPRRIRVQWRSGQWLGPYAKGNNPSALAQVRPGQVWRMAMVLKPPYGVRNPNGFDAEAHAFTQNVRAVGVVRGEPVLLDDQPFHSISIMAERARYQVREAMRPYLQNQRYGAVLLALAIGDQAAVEADDWQVFNRTGITHLVSISGTHVTLIASLAGMLVLAGWRRLRVRGTGLAERFPAQIAATLVALLVAWLYCLLAGWGVPAQRTFLMLATVALSYVLRLRLGSFRLLIFVAFVVVILDPWAMLSTGFWLSFGAVAVLMAWGQSLGQNIRRDDAGFWRRLCRIIWAGTKVQLLMTVTLFPVLALLFNEISLVSPLVNAYAIPLISIIVTPLSLLGAALAVLPGFQQLAEFTISAAHTVLVFMMMPTVWLAQAPLASMAIVSAPTILTVIALLGLAAALMPRGWPARHAGWLLMLPALCWAPSRPPHGAWNVYALDVGQASAIVIQTANHDFLFDTGIRQGPSSDSGTRIIVPFLRSLGISRLSALVVSHADIDHVGGLSGVLENVDVMQTYSSFDLVNWLRREAKLLNVERPESLMPAAAMLCRYGQSWSADGVDFHMLWPKRAVYSAAQADSRERNDNSCVLSVQGQHHAVLLPGDISAGQERELVLQGLTAHDVVVAAHHGSRNSSAREFIEASQATHVITQAGAWSRYGHPHPAAVQRWMLNKTQVWRTDHHGAITALSRKQGLHVLGERLEKRRYWQTIITD